MTVNVSEVLRERAARSPDSTAIIEAYGPRRRLTWAELDAQADAVASWLSQAGLVAGHRAGIALANRIEFVTAYFGILRIGAVAVPMNPRSATGEFARMVEDSGVRVVVVDETTASPIRTTGARLVLAGGQGEDGETAFEDLLSAESAALPPVPSDPEALATLLYTSGTSGQPRGVMLSHRALLANIDQVASIEPPVMTEDDVVLGILPLFHIYGLNCVLTQCVRQGASLALVDRFDPDATLDLVPDLAVTNIPIAPPVVAAWAGRDAIADRLSGVRRVLSGASALDPELSALFTSSSGVVIEQGYGLTETAPVLTTTLAAHRGDDGTSPKPGSVGRALDGVEIRIVDATGQDAHREDPGEIVVRGANLFSGYWPDAKDGPDADGWYATGDVGVLDGDGDLSLVDRLRELVIVSGFNVYPREVEDVITELDEVAEAAVIGTQDAETGEAVSAFVVPVEVADDGGDDWDVLVSKIRAHCEERLARFKWPRHIDVVTGLPHSATGKVAKGRLRAQARRQTLGLD